MLDNDVACSCQVYIAVKFVTLGFVLIFFFNKKHYISSIVFYKRVNKYISKKFELKKKHRLYKMNMFLVKSFRMCTPNKLARRFGK